MRELNIEDAFALSQILDKTGLQIDINAYADAAKKGKDAQAYMGGQLVLSILKKIHLAKNEIIKLLADVSEEDIEDVKKWNISKIKDVFTEIFKNTDLKDFFL